MKSRLDNFWSDYLADPASLSQSQALPKFLWEEGISPKYRKQIWATVRPRPEPLFETKTDSREERDTVIRAARAQVEANVKPELQTSAQDGLIPEVSEETTARILRVVARFVEENCLESYQQGLATLTYTVLLVAGNDEQVAVDVLKVLGERVLPFRMRDNERLKQDVLILADLLVQDLPEVAAALNTASIDVVDLSDVLCSWFEATFASFFPHYAIQRLLDIALLEGMHNWFAFAYGLFQVSKNPLIEVEPRKLFQIVVSMPKLSEPQLQEAFAAGYENVRANADKVEELRAGRSWSKLMEVPGTVGFVRGVGMPDMVAAVRAERMLDVDTKEVLSQRNIGRSSVAETGDASAEQGGGTEATGGDDDDRANDADTADDPAQEQDSAGGGDDGNDEDSSRTGGQQVATASAGAHRSRLGSDELEMEMEQPHRESLQIVLNQHVSMEQPDLLLRLETIRGTTMDPGVAAIVGDAQAEIRRQTSSILELQDELKQREATWQQERQRLLSEAHRGNRRGRGGDSLEDSEMSYSASDEEDDYSDRYGGGSGGAGDDSSMMGDSDWSEDVSGNDRAGSSESLGSGGDTLATPVHRRRGGKKKKKAVVLQPGMVPYSKLFQYQQFPCIYMEGYLLKARKKTMAPGRRPTTGLFGNLHRRFFVLQGSFITYFKSHRNLTPSKDVSIDMAGRQVRRLENHKFGKYGFEITGVNSDECLYLLFASNADERNVWVQVLQAATET